MTKLSKSSVHDNSTLLRKKYAYDSMRDQIISYKTQTDKKINTKLEWSNSVMTTIRAHQTIDAVKDSLLKLLDKYRLPPIENDKTLSSIPSNYAELESAALRQELEDLIASLNEIIVAHHDVDVIRSLVLALFAQREPDNYLALPESSSNQLCWEIAQVLFNPPNFGAILTIILPNIKERLDIIHQLLPATHDTSSLRSRRKLTLDLAPLDTLSVYAVDAKLLAQIIVGDGVLLMLDDIRKLPLDLHQQLYDQLEQHYPKISTQLYNHNQDFKQLLIDMQRGVATPRIMVRRFADELKRAGTRYTGAEMAASSAAITFLRFLGFLNILPVEMRVALLAAEGISGITLETTINKLAQCVETGASRLEEILANPKNARILDATPHASPEELAEIERKYKRPINIISENYQYSIPQKLQDKLLTRIQITSVYDYLDLLINIPTDKYAIFLQHAKITCSPLFPNFLGEALATLNQEQRKAFFTAIIKFQEKFGGDKEILRLMILCKDTDAIKSFLNTKSEEDKLALLSDADFQQAEGDRGPYDSTLLHLAAKMQSSSVLSVCMASLSEVNQQIAINKNQMLETATEFYTYEKWKIIWDCYTEKSFATREKYILDKALLHYAAKNWQDDERIYARLIAEFPKEKQQALLHITYEHNRTNLHTASLYRLNKIVKMMLTLIPQCEHWNALLALDATNDSSLAYLLRFHSPLPSADFLPYVLPIANRFAALQSKIRNNESVLHFAARNSRFEVWSSIWSLLSDEEKPRAASIEDSDGNRLLNMIMLRDNDDAMKIFDSIWIVLEDRIKSAALGHRNHNKKTLLHQLVDKAVTDFDFLPYILRLYSSHPEHWQILLEQDSKGNSLIMAAAMNSLQKTIDAILAYSPKKHLCRLLFAPNKECQTILHLAVRLFDFAHWQKLWDALSLDEQLLAFELRCSYNSSILHYAACNADPRVFQSLWQQLTKKSKAPQLNDASKNGWTYLDWAISRNMQETSLAMLDLYPLDEKFSAILRKNDMGEMVLHRAALVWNFEGWHKLWERFLPDQQAQALQEKDNNDSTLLHYAACNKDPKLFKSLWSPLRAKDTSKNGNSYLHWAAENYCWDTYIEILMYYSDADRLSAILTKNVAKKTSLDLWMKTPSFVYSNLSPLLPETDQVRLKQLLFPATVSAQGMFAQDANLNAAPGVNVTQNNAPTVGM